MARAAPVERSRTRPRMNGPRSLMVTRTLEPPWETRSLVPNGSERCAAVMAFWLKRWPAAVLLPDSVPYTESLPEKERPVPCDGVIDALALRQSEVVLASFWAWWR